MKPHIRSFLLRLWKGRQLVLTVNVSAMSNRVVGKLDWSKLVHVQWSSPKQNESLKQETTAERESCESEAKIIPFHWRYRYGQSVPFQDTTSAYISWGSQRVQGRFSCYMLYCNCCATRWTHPYEHAHLYAYMNPTINAPPYCTNIHLHTHTYMHGHAHLSTPRHSPLPFRVCQMYNLHEHLERRVLCSQKQLQECWCSGASRTMETTTELRTWDRNNWL